MPSKNNSVEDDFRRRLSVLVDRGWPSRAQFATHAGLSPQAVSNYINGQREPGAWELLKLARALSVSMDYLLTGQEAAAGPAPGPTPPRRPARPGPEEVRRTVKTARESLAALDAILKKISP